MRARALTGLLRKGDRVAVSNITGREASKVSIISQQHSGNIVSGWALGKEGQQLSVPGDEDIPVFGTCEQLYAELPAEKQPNKIVIYSPPSAVYGEVKEAIHCAGGKLETLFIITENVSVEVTAKIRKLCNEASVDVLGCNTLGVMNTHDHVRVGAVGGDNPDESFLPGSATIVSNSGNMVNTIASYMLSAGIGTHFGISTGKDVLILTPLVELLKLAARSDATRLIVLYVEPGGLYEHEAIRWMRENDFQKPVIVYVAGQLMEGKRVSFGHAGAVVEGRRTSATGKMAAFDEYFGRGPFDPEEHLTEEDGPALERGIRVTTLHHLPAAAMALYDVLGWKRDFPARRELKLNPWFLNYRHLAPELPRSLMLRPGTIPEPYSAQFQRLMKATVGLIPSRRSLRSASHASALEEGEPRIYGYPLTEVMSSSPFGEAVILYWTGELPRYDFEPRLVEMTLTASLTNGPGTISAQGAKLSASAGNMPNTAMIATLAAIGDVHGGNGRLGVEYLLKVFGDTGLDDPYDPDPSIDVAELAQEVAAQFKKTKDAAKESGVEYERIPGVGHPVFNDRPVNYDPRERAVYHAIEETGHRNVFLDFYHELVKALYDVGVATKVWAVNMDAVLACVWLGVCWKPLMEKRITLQRAKDCAFLGFALGRAAGGAGEFLDHQDHGTPMDMRLPASECRSLTPRRQLPKDEED